MEFDATREQWIQRCAFRLAQLQPGAATDQYNDRARSLWERLGHLPPEDVAEAEHGPGPANG